MTNFNEMTVPELRALCKERGDITGYSRMRKAELIEVLEENTEASEVSNNVVIMAQGNLKDTSPTFTSEKIANSVIKHSQVIDFGHTMPENLNRKQRRMWMKRNKMKNTNPNMNLRMAFS